MTPTQIQHLADGITSMLLSHAAHGLAISALEGMGEITLRDSLVVACAAAGARARQAWILDREITPDGWKDAPVDLTIFRKGNNDEAHELGGIELKWWRRTDPGNAGNRRRDLLKDMLRAAALYPDVEEFAFVALLSTTGSWKATARTSGSDAAVMKLLASSKTRHWNVSKLIGSSALRGAVKALRGRVPITTAFQTKLLSKRSLSDSNSFFAFARVWSVHKTRNSRFLSTQERKKLLSS